MPQVRSAPDFTAVSHDTTNYASLFEPLKGPSRPLSLNSRSPLREEIYHEEHSRSQNRKKLSQMVTMFCQTDERIRLQFVEENISKKQEVIIYCTDKQSRGYGPELCYGKKRK